MISHAVRAVANSGHCVCPQVVYNDRARDLDEARRRVNLKERAAFMAGEKLVAVISDAASTGVSLHADKRWAVGCWTAEGGWRPHSGLKALQLTGKRPFGATRRGARRERLRGGERLGVSRGWLVGDGSVMHPQWGCLGRQEVGHRMWVLEVRCSRAFLGYQYVLGMV